MDPHPPSSLARLSIDDEVYSRSSILARKSQDGEAHTSASHVDTSCVLCMETECCPDHCCDWDTCECRDCPECFPAHMKESATRQDSTSQTFAPRLSLQGLSSGLMEEAERVHFGAANPPPDGIYRFEHLSVGLKIRVMKHLDYKSIGRAGCTCREWRALTRYDDLWYYIYKDVFCNDANKIRNINESVNWMTSFRDRLRAKGNWDSGNYQQVVFEGHKNYVGAVDRWDDTVASASDEGELRLWSLRGKPPTIVQAHDGAITAMKISPLRQDEAYVATASSDGTAAVWSIYTGALIKRFSGHEGLVYCLLYDHPELITGSMDNTIKVWDVDTGDCTTTLRGHQAYVFCMHMNNDFLVSGSEDGIVHIWDRDSGYRMTGTVKGHTDLVSCVFVTDYLVLSGACDMTVRVSDVANGKPMHVLEGHSGPVNCLNFYRGTVISGSYDGTIRLWDSHNGSCTQVLTGHNGFIRCMEVCEKYIICGSVDCKIRVWDATTGLKLFTFVGHKDSLECIYFDSVMAISGSRDCTVRVWRFDQ